MPTKYDELRTRDAEVVRCSTAVADRVGAADWSRPTPCAEWDVRALLAHMTGQHHEFATAFGAAAAAAATGDPVADYRAAVELVLTAFAEVDPDVLVRVPSLDDEHDLPVVVAVSAHLVDFVAHSWDLAVAIGVDRGLPDSAVAAALEISRRIPDAAYGPGAAFGPRVSTEASASLLDETLGLLGRDPAWSPPA